MNPEDAPIGTICVVGHPANGVTARKGDFGIWRYTHNNEAVDFDTQHKAMSAVFVPGK